MIVLDEKCNVITIIITHNHDNNYLCQSRNTIDTHTKYFSLNMNLHLLYSVFLTFDLFKTTIDKFC